MGTPGHPHIVHYSGLNNLADSVANSSHGALNADLVDKIVYDDPRVFKRLCVDEVDDNLVTACVRKGFKEEQWDLEREEKADKADDSNKVERSGNHGSAEERRMYDPLVRLLNYIRNFGGTTPPRREFQKTNGMLKPNEPHTFGFPSCSPDLTVSADGKNASRSKMWHDRDAFGEVRPSKKQGPKPTIAGTIPDIVTQAADYAKEVFIRIVRSLTCNLSIQNLGSDPTHRILDHSATQRLAGQRSKGFLSAVVSSVGNDSCVWGTIGPPVWTSMSFLGRGTNIWLVCQYLEGTDWMSPFLHGNDMITKTAWRGSARTPKSDIYMSVTRPPRGLAEFGGCLITVKTMANNSLPQGDPLATPVFHRLVLR